MAHPFFILILLAASNFLLAYGQDSTSTEFQIPETTTYEDAIEIVSTAVLVPLAVGSTIISVVPPSGGVVLRDGKVNGILTFETGVGFGEKVDLKRFSDARFIIGYSHIFSQDQRDFLRVEAKEDFHIGFVDRRELFLFGVSPSAGIFTDFPSMGYSVGISSWLMTPWLSYFGFIPQHTFGITYRYDKYFGGKKFGEISAGMSAAFTWGWL